MLSGGQAAGGHNVIMGLFDMSRKLHPDSKLFGFLAGPHGIFSNNYQEITPEFMGLYRNTGGFDMIRKCKLSHKLIKLEYRIRKAQDRDTSVVRRLPQECY